ncbi:MAG TPA: replication-relaxation family protein, partial [Chthoniobacterales bacterium]
MDLATTAQSRRPRFRRVAEPPAFQITDGDLAIVRAIAHHRFLRSTQIARIVGRSLDRTNRRLLFLFHAGYIDRPRAQLDRFPVDGSSHMVYALADAGARLLKVYDGQTFPRGERSSNNRSALRPFIEHQLAITEFHVTLQEAARDAGGIQTIAFDEIVAAFPIAAKARRNPLKISTSILLDGHRRDIAVIP